MTPAAGREVFRPPVLGRILTAAILSALLGGIALVLIPRVFPVTTSREVRAEVTLVAVLVIVAAVCGGVLWWRNLRVVVDADTVEVWRPGQRLHTWDRGSTTFSGSTTRRYVNGLPSGTVRMLVARTAGGRDEVAVLLTRPRFTELMALIAPVAPAPEGTADGARPSQTG